MPSEKLYSEILDEFKLQTTKENRIKTLQKYKSFRFMEFLVAAFNKNIKFDVEIPEYKPSKLAAGLNDTYIDIEFRRIYLFHVGNSKRPSTLTKEKQSKLLRTTLEALHKDEAELFVHMLKKDLQVPFLTSKLVKEAYPEINI